MKPSPIHLCKICARKAIIQAGREQIWMCKEHYAEFCEQIKRDAIQKVKDERKQ